MLTLPSWAWKAIGGIVIALTILVCGMRLMSIWDAPKILKLQGAQAHAVAVVRQETAVDKTITIASAKSEKAAQHRLSVRALSLKQKVHLYVPEPIRLDAPGCITVGMLRVHDAAVAGVDPARITAPGPDTACSAVKPADFMAGVAGNYAVAASNAEQLDALEADVKARQAAHVDAAAP